MFQATSSKRNSHRLRQSEVGQRHLAKSFEKAPTPIDLLEKPKFNIKPKLVDPIELNKEQKVQFDKE